MLPTHLLKPEIQHFIAENAEADVTKLLLKYKQIGGVPMAEVVQQIQARKKAQTKLPLWYGTQGILYPPLLSMEQCSSEIAARAKADMVSGLTLIDLTGGFGVDSYYFAQKFATVYHVEQNEALSAIAAHNFGQLGAANIICYATEALSFFTNFADKADCIYLDPARRNDKQDKVFRLNDCEPDVLQLLPLLFEKSRTVLLKTSPMLDIDLAISQLGAVTQITVLAIDNDCKEVLYLLSCSQNTEPNIQAINLLKNGISQIVSFTKSAESAANPPLALPETYIYEPNAALLKAGALKIPAQVYGLNKLHPNSHLFTSNKLVPEFPGRAFVCKAVVGYDKKAMLAFVPDQKANIAVRNFPDTVAQIRKKTGIKDGGSVYMFATTNMQNKAVILICEKT